MYTALHEHGELNKLHQVQMAGQFFLMSFLLLSAPVNVHSALAINQSPLVDDITREIMETLNKLEGGVAVLAACQHRKSGEGEGLGAVVAQLVTDLHNTKSQLQSTQAELQLQLQDTKKELQNTQAELQATQTELQSQLKTTKELQATQTELQSQLKTTKELQAIQTELQNTQEELKTNQTELQLQFQTTQRELQNTQTELQDTQTELLNTQTELQSTQTELQNTQTEVQATQAKLQNTQTELQSQLQNTQKELQTSKTELQTELQSQLQNIQTELTNRTALLKMDPGSAFVRWGRKSCPANTTLVYSGVAGGKHYKQKGSGTNILCLTRSPQFDNTTVPPKYGYLYGAEYEVIGNHDDHDVPCSLCRAPQSTTIMMAATLTCPPGWTAQYTGHLTAQYHDHYAAEYVCLDRIPENDSGAHKNEDGLLFYQVITQCGSLPCPPYQHEKVVTCIVCSR